MQNADYSSVDATYAACSTCQLEIDYTGYTISYIECCTDEVTTSQLVNFPLSGSTPAVNTTFQIDGTCYKITNIISTTKPSGGADNASVVTLNDSDCSKCFANGGNACPTPTPSPSATISITPTNTPTKTPSISVTQTPSISVTQTPSISLTPTTTPAISLTPTATPSIRVVNYSALNCCDGTRIYVTISDGPAPAPNVGFIHNGECYYFENTSATPGTFFVDSSDWIANICNDGACVCPTATPSASPSVTQTPSISVTQTPSISVTQTPSISVTQTPSVSITPTPSISVTQTPSISVTQTPSISVTQTPSVSITPTPSISVTQTQSVSITPTNSQTPTPSPTPNYDVWLPPGS